MDVPAGTSCPTRTAAQAQGLSVARPDHLPSRRRSPGLADKTAAASAQVAAFFGAATAAQLGASRRRLPTYGGHRPATGVCGAWRCTTPGWRSWPWRGGRLRPGLGAARPDHGARRGLGYPAVTALKSLAGEVAHPAGASDPARLCRRLERVFRPPAAGRLRRRRTSTSTRCGRRRRSISSAIDFYPPMADWRDGDGHLDAGRQAARPGLSAGEPHRGRGLRLVLRLRRRPGGPGPHPDHRRRLCAALGVPAQGPAVVVEPSALQPPRRCAGLDLDRLGPEIQAAAAGRVRLRRGRQGRQRPEPVR